MNRTLKLGSKKKNSNDFTQKFRSSFGNSFRRFNVGLQRLGKALLFPIAVLPIAALMNRIGTLLSDPTIGIVKYSAIWWIGQFIMAPGAAVFNNIAIIFGIGVAFGFAKDYRGEAAICGGHFLFCFNGFN